MISVHVTHEAIQKFGGIGTVLHGLFTSEAYQTLYPRTLLVTPLFHKEGRPDLRLGDDATVLYSSMDHIDQAGFGHVFAPIERASGVGIVYGKKRFYEERSAISMEVDIVAIDVWSMHADVVNAFKFKLWEHVGLQSDRYTHDTDYEQYLRLGPITRPIIEAIYGTDERAILFSHEYMGMAAALALVIEEREGRRFGDKTVFYAHEVSTARSVVESHPGHDVAFYPIMRFDRDQGRHLEDTFGSFSHYSRNELVKRASCLSAVFAVSEVTREELLYLCPQADPARVHVVFNGVQIEDVGWSDKVEARTLIADYCHNLFLYRPDYLFTHVARLVPSKAFWRDLRLLYAMDEHLHARRQTGFFVVLSTLVGDGRTPAHIRHMENDYGWPVLHRDGWPDLMGAERDLYHSLELFNSRSKAVKGVFLNQFGFSYERCGDRVPQGANLLHLRMASDVEFGLSIYEPFGIAQIETVPYGGTAVLSSACGCADQLRASVPADDYIEIDFTMIPAGYREMLKNRDDYLSMTTDLRGLIETDVCTREAVRIVHSLPHDDKDRRGRFTAMRKKAKALDWDHVVEKIRTILQG